MLAAARLDAALQMALGEQKFDGLLIDPHTEPKPIHEIARSEGVELTATQNPEYLRLLSLLEVVRREANWLRRAERRLFAYPLDQAWFTGLEQDVPRPKPWKPLPAAGQPGRQVDSGLPARTGRAHRQRIGQPQSRREAQLVVVDPRLAGGTHAMQSHGA